MDLVQWGVPLVEWLQARTWLHGPAQFFSLAGDVRIMVLWIPVVAWTVDRRLGRRLLLAMMSWGTVNSLAKMLFAEPRPYWVVASVEPLAAESSFGFPSGHAAFAMVVWGALALAVPRRAVRVLSLLMIAGIGTSRVILGVHWPADVIGGWLLGAVVLAVVVALDGGTRPGQRPTPFTGLPTPAKLIGIGLAAAVPLASTLVVADVAVVDEGWTTLAARGGEEIDPTSVVGAFVLVGGLVGTLLGSLGRRGSSHGLDLRTLSGSAHTLRLAVGLGVVLGLASGLGSLVDQANDAHGPIAFVLGALVAWWIVDGAPKAFDRLGLNGTPLRPPRV